MKLESHITHILGIDEVGRGPLAGPVTLGFALIPRKHIDKLPGGITDSKMLSSKKREAYTGELKRLMKKGIITLFTVNKSAQYIDENGISKAIASCITSGCLKVGRQVDSRSCYVLLDGGLYAPEVFTLQETIVKGDQKEPLIGAASVFAKVVRDKYMRDLDKEYPLYEFGKHKGYGTKKHRKMIEEYGFTEEHRRSFCKNVRVDS